MVFDQIVTERFDQPAILHSAGTGRFASPAVEAQIEMMFDILIKRNTAIHHATH
jgi:hypothetical protein